MFDWFRKPKRKLTALEKSILLEEQTKQKNAQLISDAVNDTAVDHNKVLKGIEEARRKLNSDSSLVWTYQLFGWGTYSWKVVTVGKVYEDKTPEFSYKELKVMKKHFKNEGFTVKIIDEVFPEPRYYHPYLVIKVGE